MFTHTPKFFAWSFMRSFANLRLRRRFFQTSMLSSLSCLGVSALLASCGGGSGEGPSATPAPNDEVATISVTPASPIATFDPVGTIDLSSESEVLGKTVRVTRLADNLVNDVVQARKAALFIETPDDSVIGIVTPVRPNGAIPARFKVRGPASSLQEAYVAYAFTPASGDGAENVETLKSTYFRTQATVETLLPPYVFVEVAGEFRARVKIARATTYSQEDLANAQKDYAKKRISTIDKASLSTIPAHLLIDCPLDRCIETSQYNPERHLGGIAKPHFGTDFKATVNDIVFAPALSTVRAGLTPRAQDTAKAPQGISLLLGPGPGLPQVFFFHLSEMDSSFIDPANPLQLNFQRAPTGTRTPIGKAGKSGADDVHLHMETYLPFKESCDAERPAGIPCRSAYASTDSLIQMIASFEIASPAPELLTLNSPQIFTIKALDKSGKREISSLVDKAKEAMRGDPTRKLCFSDTFGIFEWATSGDKWPDQSGGQDLICTEWQSTVTGKIIDRGETEVQVRYSTYAPKIFDSAGSIVAKAVYGIGGCPPPPDPNATRLPRVCRNAFARLTAGVVRPITDFVTIDPGNDPRVTSIYVGMGFFKDEPGGLSITNIPKFSNGSLYYYGRETDPFFTSTTGVDIYYSCQELTNPHPNVFANAMLSVPAGYSGASVQLPVFIVQYQRKLQDASCANGGYLPFERVNISDCPSGRTAACEPFVIPVTKVAE